MKCLREACGAHRSSQKLPLLGLDQTAEFGHLDTSLDKLGNDICETIGAQTRSLSNEVDNAASRVPSLEQELKEYVSFVCLRLSSY